MAASTSPSVTLIVPGDPAQRTGGYLYDARIVAGLRDLGRTVEVIGLDGRFPDADAAAQDAMHEALSAIDDARQVIIDGLALGGVPGAVAAHRDRLDLVGLVHHPLADERGQSPEQQQRLLDSERAALACCRCVIVTSEFTRHRLDELGLLSKQPVHVVEPGVDPAPLARRVEARLNGASDADPARLLCVASLTPRKGQDVLIQALSGLGDRAWFLRLVGSAARAPGFARQLRAQIDSLGLADRVEVLGEADTDQLNAAYDWADVCLLPSWYEGYGMVVTEALARGLPLITSTGGALADTVPAAAALRVPAGEADALRRAIDSWLSDPARRHRLTLAAVAERDRLTRWPAVATRFAAALESGLVTQP
jgi:glycosyltransferase involved in cell wall biosynthesis